VRLSLPWYLVMGAPGAGKTTALLNAGLNFPLTDTLGKTRALALLQRVAAGGINQHRAVGEPPVAVAGAAHA
jgi:predicted ATPase